MDPARRIVTRIPLDSLWDGDAAEFGTRLRALGREEIRALLREGPFRFAEAWVGRPLRWFPAEACVAQWRRVAPHLLDAASGRACGMPQGLGFLASEWRGAAGERIVLLEAQH